MSFFVKLFVVHCSATKEGKELTPEQLEKSHNARKIDSPMGYHAYIRRDGTIVWGRPTTRIGAHARVDNHNYDSLGVCYEGGLDANGNPKDTRTAGQKVSILKVFDHWFLELSRRQPISGIEIVGHRDLSPDQDGDGVVEEHEWLKQCPCFDAITEYQWLTV